MLFLLRSEVVCDIKGFANLLRRLALNHVGDGLASDIEKGLDVKVIGSLMVKLLEMIEHLLFKEM